MRLKSVVMVTGLAAFTLAGCTNPQTGQPNRTGTGALLGAALGAGIGAAVSKNDTRGALIGATVGAIAGLGAGAYMDAQAEELNKDLAGTGADVQRVNDQILLTLPAGITFDVDSASLRPDLRGSLSKVAQTLNEYPSTYIDVVGHTDSTGSEDYNQRLSERRADSVASALKSYGVDAVRVVAWGEGERNPVASNSSAAGRQENRRVEIRITPVTK